MRKISVISVMAAILLCACVKLTTYPIQLHYAPEGAGPEPSSKLGRKTVTVATFKDNREIPDKFVIGREIGIGGKQMPFVSSKGYPSDNVTAAFKSYLEKRGYTVRKESPNWNLDHRIIKPQWGDCVVGGTIDELSVMVSTGYVKTVYDCKLTMKVTVADAQQKKGKFSERIELSSSHTRVGFKLETAEKMINTLLSDAIERTMVELEK